MKKIAKGFALALSMLTIVPLFKVHDFFRGINGYAVAFYPLIGLLVGLVLWGIGVIGTPYFTQFHLGILIFSLWVVLTGALHLDGFCDTIDGLYVPKDRALAVMKEPYNGGMSMIFGATFLILKASSVASLPSYELLPLVLMLSRFNGVVAIFLFPYISKKGMGSLAKEELTQGQFIFAALYVALTAIYFSPQMLLIALLVLFVVQSIFIKRYNGFTGDIYGFLIEVSEVVLLNVILVGGA